MCLCMCVCVHVGIHVQVSTATSLAWSHEVNPRGFHQFLLREVCPVQTSAVYEAVAALSQEALLTLCTEGMPQREVDDEEEGEVEVGVASPPFPRCSTLLRPWR